MFTGKYSDGKTVFACRRPSTRKVAGPVNSAAQAFFCVSLAASMLYMILIAVAETDHYPMGIGMDGRGKNCKSKTWFDSGPHQHFACGDYPDKAEGVDQNKPEPGNMASRRTHFPFSSHPTTATLDGYRLRVHARAGASGSGRKFFRSLRSWRRAGSPIVPQPVSHRRDGLMRTGPGTAYE